MSEKPKNVSLSELKTKIKERYPESYEIIQETSKLNSEKFKEYRKTHNIPEFKTVDEYYKWLKTSEGKAHEKAIEKIKRETDNTIKKKRGGYRPGAGRKKLAIKKAKYTFELQPETKALLTDFAKANGISQNKVLDEIIKRSLNSNECFSREILDELKS